MKKILIIISVVLMSLVASAQSYRGMVELGIGVTGSGPSYSNEMGTFKLNNGFLGSFTTSHGCQITPSIFIGAGVGVDIGLKDSFKTPILNSKYNREDFRVRNEKGYFSCLEIPVFLDLRWDLDIRRKVTPFIDIKIGYSINSDWEGFFYGPGSYISFNDTGDTRIRYQKYVDKYGYGPFSCSVDAEGISSLYFKPTIGVRIKFRKNCGLNMGVSYEAFQSCFTDFLVRIVGGPYNQNGYEYWGDEYDYIEKRFIRGAWMFNLGFDF